jgi:hypothetical protein
MLRQCERDLDLDYIIMVTTQTGPRRKVPDLHCADEEQKVRGMKQLAQGHSTSEK